LNEEGKVFILKGELVGFTHKDKGSSMGARVPEALQVFLFDDIILATKPTKEKKKCFDDIMRINDGFILHQHPRTSSFPLPPPPLQFLRNLNIHFWQGIPWDGL